MERLREKWSVCGIVILASILALASVLHAQKDAGQVASSQQDIDDLRNAQEYITRNQLGEAKAICERLVNKGGIVTDQAQACIGQISARRAYEHDAQQVFKLNAAHACQQANELLQSIRQKYPDFSGLRALDVTVRHCEPLPPPPSLPALEGGITPNKKGGYRKEKAKEQWQAQRQKLAAEDDRSSKLRTKPEAPAGADLPGHERDRAPAEDALLAKAIREYYAGNLSHADQLLEQYMAQPDGYQALAYFYRGAIACTDYFLAGAKDQQKAALARELFSKARQSDPKFHPPGSDYISPKIMNIYETAVVGN